MIARFMVIVNKENGTWEWYSESDFSLTDNFEKGNLFCAGKLSENAGYNLYPFADSGCVGSL